MYSDVVMEKASGIEPEEGMGIRNQLEHELEKMKEQKNSTKKISPKQIEALYLANVITKEQKELVNNLTKSFQS